MPDVVKLFRTLLIAELVIGSISAVVDCFEPHLLPADLKSHATDFGAYAPLYVATLVALETTLVAGLWHYKRWARFLLTAVLILAPLGSLVEPDVQSGLGAALSAVDYVLLGALLLTAWSVLPEKFVRSPSLSAQPA